MVTFCGARGISRVRRTVLSRAARENASTIDEALAFADEVRNQPHAQVIGPGAKFWGIFVYLCRQVSAGGKLVSDAYLAALAIEHGCEVITADKDFRRFPRLRWRHPLN